MSGMAKKRNTPRSTSASGSVAVTAQFPWQAKMEMVRELALALPGASEQDHFGRPSFRVGKRIFATLWPKEGKAMVKLTGAQQADFEEEYPGTFARVPGHWGMQGATFVMLTGEKKVTKAALRRALRMAWESVAAGAGRRSAGKS